MMKGFLQIIIEKTIQNYKKLDVLVKRTGVGIPGSLQDTLVEIYEKIFVILTKLAVPYLIENNDNVVHILSLVAGLRPLPAALAC